MERMSHWFVAGAGLIGCAVAYDAVKLYNVRLTVFDVNSDAINASKNKLLKLLTEKESARIVFAAGPKPVIPPHTDVVVSCAPYAANVELASQAIIHDVPYCDLGGSPDVVNEQVKLFTRIGTTRGVLVPECGISPGIAQIVAAHFAREGCNEIYVRCGGNLKARPQYYGNPWMYKILFSPEGLAEEYSGLAVEIHNGELRAVEAMSYVESFDDELEWFPTSNNARQAAEYLLKLGVKEFDYGTLRYHGHAKAVWNECRRLGVRMTQEEMSALVRRKPELQFDRDTDEDTLKLSVKGWRNERGMAERHASYELDVPFDTVTRFTAMELATAWGITTVAHQLAKGKVLAGFMLPQEFMDARWVMGEIDRRLAHYFPEK